MSLNAADVHYKSFAKNLLPVASDMGLDIIAMKILAYGNIFAPDGITEVQEAMNYVYSLPIDIGVVGVDNVEQLEENVNAAKDLKKLSKSEMKSMEDLTSKYYKTALFYREGLEDFNLYW
jgi:aryl-alcohol dehydrogenase-like predicted oxidoreductase